MAIATFGMFNLNAQDGEKLFKTNCGACHKVNEKVIGPALEGISAKWNDAGEKENLYEWVKDSQALIKSGKSKLAMALDDDKSIAITMTPQLVSNDEIDAIFNYIDNWVAPVEEKAIVVPPGGKIPLYQTTELNTLSDATNSTIFSFQLILLVFLLLAALFFSSTIKKLAILSLDNKKNGSSVKTLLALLATGIATTIPTYGYSLSFDMSGERWINATFSDNVILFVINLIILGLIIYLRGVIKTVSESVNPGYYVNKAGEKIKSSEATSLASVLTGQVAIEDEKSILIDHDFDGIQELDNHLPPWWLWSFYASIVFAIYYHAVHDVFVTTPDQYVLYENEMKEAEQEIATYMLTHGPKYDETNVTLATEESELSAGKAVFAEKCAVCHMADGQGSVGPNLTDDYWLYANDIKGVFSTVKFGTKAGMPEHDSKLKADQIRNVASYVLSLPFVEGKAPQGEKK